MDNYSFLKVGIQAVRDKRVESWQSLACGSHQLLAKDIITAAFSSKIVRQITSVAQCHHLNC